MKRPGSRKHGTKKVLGLVMVVGLMSAGTYAFTNSNTVDATKAGDGAGAISGYTITNVDYTVDDTSDPAKITAYTFDLNAPADSAKAKLDPAQVGWDTCTVGLVSPYTVSCTTPLTSDILDATSLRVVAYDDTKTI